MDNSGRPNETEMIDGEPYSVDDLRYLAANDPDWDIWYQNLSEIGQWTVNQMLKGKNYKAG